MSMPIPGRPIALGGLPKIGRRAWPGQLGTPVELRRLPGVSVPLAEVVIKAAAVPTALVKVFGAYWRHFEKDR